MAKSRGNLQLWPVGTRKPSTLAWIVAVFAVAIQLSAFMQLPMIMQPHYSPDDLSDPSNPLNTACIGASLASMVIAAGFVYRDIIQLLKRNKAILAFIFLVVISTAWSIHPELTIRRSISCMLSILIAAYLTVRFGEKDSMKVFSFALAISAIGSVLFVAAYPDYGIQPEGWRGVFPNKNVLGHVMAAAIFVELYLLVLGKWRPIWRFGLLSTYFLLLILSESRTSLICSVIFFTGTVVYIIGTRDKLAGIIVAIILFFPLFLLQLGLWYNADLLLSFIGKDSTLTGRTDLWLATLDLIAQKPLLGRGYMATWVATDPEFAAVRDQVGWAAPNAHSGYLDLALQLGLVGLGLLLTIIAIAWQRGTACCRRGILPLGWFSLIFIVGLLLKSVSETGLGETQIADWVLLNVLSFSCGLRLAALRRRGSFPNSYVPLVPRKRGRRFATHADPLLWCEPK